MSLRKYSGTKNEWYDGAHRFEHWYRDNTVYLITARVRDKRHVFATPETQAIFWDRFDHWTSVHGFTPWLTTLMSNHYHTIGYVDRADEIGEMMRKLHGSAAMLVCKSLAITHKPFWLDDHHRDYFDGCLRDEIQLRRSYAYVRDQAVHAGLVSDARDYPNTRISLGLDEAVAFANARDAWLPEVPYARYDDRSRKRGRGVDPR
jgi:REP element-mobilizing transposase RayT